MSEPIKIELFFPSGNVDSLVVARQSLSSIKTIKIPRLEVKNCERDDIKRAGVYFLFWTDENDNDCVYIGESQNVKDRLLSHLQYKPDWITAVIFTDDDLINGTIRKALEDKINKAVNNIHRYINTTKKTDTISLGESDEAILNKLFREICTMIDVMGYKLLSSLRNNESSDECLNMDEDIFIYRNGKVNAKGKQTSEGFVLLKGSIINEKTSDNPKENQKFILKRSELINSDYIINLRTTRDQLFASSAQAISFVLGYTGYSAANWVNKNGITLKQVLEETN